MSKAARAGFAFGIVGAITSLLLLIGSITMQVQQEHGVLSGVLVFILMLSLWGALEGTVIYIAFQQLNKAL